MLLTAWFGGRARRLPANPYMTADALLVDVVMRVVPDGRGDPAHLSVCIVNLKEELCNVAFSLKRIRQCRLHQIKLAANEATANGHRTLAAARIARNIKAHNRLAYLS